MEGGKVSATHIRERSVGVFETDFARARNSVVAYGKMPPSTPLSMRRNATTS
jgi:hypothetical protein